MTTRDKVIQLICYKIAGVMYNNVWIEGAEYENENETYS